MKLFAVIGKSFSGKTTFIDKVLSDEKYCKEVNLYRLPLITNRKPRKDEVEKGCNEFVSTEEINNMVSNSEVFYTKYKTEFGELIYAIRKKVLDSPNNYICDLPVELLQEFKIASRNNLFIIYLCPPISTLFKRMIKRSDNEEYEDKKWQELSRRYSNDLIKFGINSNMYLSTVYGIICLGNFIPVDDIKFKLEKFINYPPIDDYYCEVIIDNEPRHYKLYTNYILSVIDYNDFFDTIVNGNIPIVNGNYILDVNNYKLIKNK